MSVCSECCVMQPIPKCTGNIIIGEILDPSTPVYVYLINTATDRKQRFSVTSAIDGLVTLPTTDLEPAMLTPYELTIVKQTPDNPNELECIEIEGIEYTCLEISFIRCYDNTDTFITDDFTLTPA